MRAPQIGHAWHCRLYRSTRRHTDTQISQAHEHTKPRHRSNKLASRQTLTGERAVRSGGDVVEAAVTVVPGEALLAFCRSTTNTTHRGV
jgi:hypothetical protein